MWFAALRLSSTLRGSSSGLASVSLDPSPASSEQVFLCGYKMLQAYSAFSLFPFWKWLFLQRPWLLSIEKSTEELGTRRIHCHWHGVAPRSFERTRTGSTWTYNSLILISIPLHTSVWIYSPNHVCTLIFPILIQHHGIHSWFSTSIFVRSSSNSGKRGSQYSQYIYLLDPSPCIKLTFLDYPYAFRPQQLSHPT